MVSATRDRGSSGPFYRPKQAYIEGAGRWIKRLDRGEGSVNRRIYVYYVQNSR
jgi:hypothetical protein